VLAVIDIFVIISISFFVFVSVHANPKTVLFSLYMIQYNHTTGHDMLVLDIFFKTYAKFFFLIEVIQLKQKTLLEVIRLRYYH